MIPGFIICIMTAFSVVIQIFKVPSKKNHIYIYIDICLHRSGELVGEDEGQHYDTCVCVCMCAQWCLYFYLFVFLYFNYLSNIVLFC